MIDLGLSTPMFQKLNNLLVSHHRIEVTVQLLDLSHNYLMDLSKRMLSGQVDVDADGEVSRSCQVELLDPFNELQLDGKSPDDGSIYYTRMLRIVYSVISVDGGTRFDIPIFCGPLSKAERNGVVLSCTAVGKEDLASSSVWKTRSFKKNHQKYEVITVIMSEIAGEQKLAIKKIPGKGPKIRLTAGNDNAWSVCKKLAKSLNAAFFYDGRGVLNLRHQTSITKYTFKQGRDLLTEPTASFDTESVVNAVQVIGGKPSKNKHKVSYRVLAPRQHPLSPWNMGRWGKPRYLPEVISDDSIKSKATARKVGKARLKQALIEQVEVAFDCLPIPYLEEGDMCRVESDRYTGNFKLSKMSIPLTADGVCSMGYNKRVTPKGRVTKLKNLNRTRKRRNRS
jgi:hypothetical protein